MDTSGTDTTFHKNTQILCVSMMQSNQNMMYNNVQYNVPIGAAEFKFIPAWQPLIGSYLLYGVIWKLLTSFLWLCVVISILSQQLLHKMTNARAVFKAHFPTCWTSTLISKKLDTQPQCFQIMFVKCICRNIRCPLWKWSLHLSYTPMVLYTDQQKTCQIRISALRFHMYK